MNRRRRNILTVAAVFAVTAGLGYVVARASQHQAKAAAPDHIINLLSDRADPSAMAVIRGDYVQFDAKDGKTHNIGQGSGDDQVHQQLGQAVHEHDYTAKESGAFGPDEGYRVQFNKTGTYAFHDHLNPKISVTIVVYEKHQ
ncbi:MAG: hypothetical protein NVSMB39_4670 [Candidatus Saccharimonadales bacterium]